LTTQLENAAQALRDALAAGEDTQSKRAELQQLEGEAARVTAAQAQAAADATGALEAEVSVEAERLAAEADERLQALLSTLVIEGYP
jgi:hypothetical protein